MMRNLVILMIAVFMLVGCSGEKEKKVVAKDNNEVKQLETKEEMKVKPEEVAKVKKEEKMPNVIDDAINWDWDSFRKMWGEPTKKVENENGPGYQYKDFPGLTFIPDENNIVSSVIITNKDVDIYGTKVGQTPTEINKIIAIEPDYSGPNESDQWVVEHQVGETLWAYYTSKDEDKPVESILLFSAEPSSFEEESEESTDSNRPIKVILNVSDVYQDLIGQWKVKVQITSLEQEPITNGTVTIRILETSDPYSLNLETTKTVEFNNVEPGETRNYDIGADLLNQVEKVEIKKALGN